MIKSELLSDLVTIRESIPKTRKKPGYLFKGAFKKPQPLKTQKTLQTEREEEKLKKAISDLKKVKRTTAELESEYNEH